MWGKGRRRCTLRGPSEANRERGQGCGGKFGRRLKKQELERERRVDGMEMEGREKTDVKNREDVTDLHMFSLGK